MSSEISDGPLNRVHGQIALRNGTYFPLNWKFTVYIRIVKALRIVQESSLTLVTFNYQRT